MTYLDLPLQKKLKFNSKPHSQGPTSFPRWRLFSKLGELKVFTARFYYVSHDNATTCRAAMKRPLENLEVHNYPHWQTENLYDTKTSQELESSIVASLVLIEFGKTC